MSDIFQGVPRALVIDGWWMNADAAFDAPERRLRTREIWRQRARRRLVLLVALLALADVLFFGHAIGVSLALFCVVVFVASVLESASRENVLLPAILVALGVLPVIEYLQFTSVSFAILAVLVGVAWHRIGAEASLDGVLFGLRRIALFLPVGAVQSIDAWVRAPSSDVDINSVFKELLRNWAFPIGGGLLILGLLISANPVLERTLDGLLDVEFDLGRIVRRVLFWLGAAILLWPVLTVAATRLQRPIGPVRPAKVRGYGLNATSVSNALWVFNGLLGMQLVMDGAFAISGELPYGMSYAEYAHRGAYPLVVTALLAGCFALAARPVLNEGRWLKPLMVLWLVLNGLLTVASMYRLGLYVEAYGLTYLRVRAGIWMVLVAAWLGLIGWQIVKAKANGWLVLRSFAMGIGVLYVGCFVNFAEVIASYNVQNEKAETWQICSLAGTSKTAHLHTKDTELCFYNLRLPVIEGWRDWGFREWRVAQYMEKLPARGDEDENFGR